MDIEKLNNEFIDIIKLSITEGEEIPPSISVIAQKKDSEDMGILHVPIPENLIKSPDNEEKLKTKILPAFFKKMKDEYILLGITFIAQVVVKKVSITDGKSETYDYQCLYISKESKDKKERQLFKISDDGYSVDHKGDMINKKNIELLEDLSGAKEMEAGVFSNLYELMMNE